ncbi:hypothetical protein FAGAP_4313 [Fusarium agapanthi]|uniref:Uncharacterized protein n=1 Tax=Fusarium agapanthi TaxID=1803897 RepID=A0A9P5EG14_9HYPO|nr:hypothetical protein FAGAP_4313 [Fusarium agapanthi]
MTQARWTVKFIFMYIDVNARYETNKFKEARFTHYMVKYGLLATSIEEDDVIEFVNQLPVEDPAKTIYKVLPVSGKVRMYKQWDIVEIFAEDTDKERQYFLGGPDKKELEIIVD